MSSNILLADRSGHSALVEWVDGRMVAIHNQQPWQVSTNFRVYGRQDRIDEYTQEYLANGIIPEDTWGKSYWRYITAWETLESVNGCLTPTQGIELLNTLSLVKNGKDVIYSTQYSVVYNLATGEVQIATDRNYQQIYRFSLNTR